MMTSGDTDTDDSRGLRSRLHVILSENIDVGRVSVVTEEILSLVLPEMSRLLVRNADLMDALAQYERMTPQSCAKGVHTDWAADTSLSLFCPWCLLVELRKEKNDAV